MSGFIERFEICRRSSSGVLQEINGNIESGINYVAVITLLPTSSSSIFIEAIKLYEQTPGPKIFVFDFVRKWSFRASLLPFLNCYSLHPSSMCIPSPTTAIFWSEQTTS